MKIAFSVPGIPRPGGSKRAFHHPKTGRIIITDACREAKNWRAVVALSAREAYQGPLIQKPLEMWIQFMFPHPQSHYRTGRNRAYLRACAPSVPAMKPDLTKLIRAVEDALTGIIWRDDAQIVRQIAEKHYVSGTGPCTKIEVTDEISPSFERR